ncbi:MAG: type II toxin-antitoxin system VapC family toxin [Pseudorhodoplanes sp.]|nr:MAG: type II toxin-antitoxin system VapC family toxin [Pseudorhodoplanes sp.]
MRPMAIVDASVALKWFVTEPGSDLAIALLQSQPLAAPDFLLIELRAALWTRVRRNLSSLEDIRRAENEMAGIGIPLRPSSDFVRNAFDIALQLSHPIYDCLYLATALGINDLLVTADQRFLQVASASRYSGQVVALSSIAA